MKGSVNISAFVVISLMLAWSSCRKEGDDLKPEIILVITPGTSGLTTDQFVFDAGQSVNPAGGGKLFFRWNFGEDSAWDSQMTKDARKTKRFMVPGQYVLTLYALNSTGCSDTAYYDIQIGLGRSAPRPVIRVMPDTGHFLTRFTFDAGLTRDDEDSLNALKFKWDYDGDGIWDTDFDTSTVGNHVYGIEGVFKPRLEVLDPTGYHATGTAEVVVNSRDPEILPDFTWAPLVGEVGDTIFFDASKSWHMTDSAAVFTYSWRLEEGEGWTIPADTPTVYHQFRTKQDQNVILKVTDQRGLFNTTTKAIHLDPENFPPNATFDVSVPYGNIRTQFRLSAWNCTDDHDFIGDLLVRWDFNGDGTWDTGFLGEKLLFHQYDKTGHYNLTIEVKDTKGLTSRYSRKILVSPWENETGILQDSRDLQFYGTVKIGSRWWMAENLKYDFRSREAPDSMMFPNLPLNEDPGTVETYGRFYYVKDAVPDHSLLPEKDIVHQLCPRGWRIPTRDEWEELIAVTHAEKEPENLVLGGKSDFNATYMGYADYEFIRYPSGMVRDTVFTFRDTFKKAWFFSSTQPVDLLRTDLYMIRIDRNGPEFWQGWQSLKLYVPVRCIKEE